jgi:hypothetical protein
VLRVGAGQQASGQRQRGSSLATIAHSVSTVDACRGDLDAEPLPVHIDDDHDPGSDVQVITMRTSAERSSTSRRSVTVAPSTAIDGWVTCGAQLRHAADRAAPLGYVARPANRPAGPCRLLIA